MLYRGEIMQGNSLIEEAYRKGNAGSTSWEIGDISRYKSMYAIGFGYLDHYSETCFSCLNLEHV